MKEQKHARLKVQRIDFSRTQPHEENPRKHPPKGTPQYERLRASLANEYFDPMVWNKRNGKMASGHYRRMILMDEGFKSADMVVVDWDEKTHKARMLAANELNGEFDQEKLLALVKSIGEELDADLTGLTDERIREILALAESETQNGTDARQTLAERFGVPPFSVLDARQGYWQTRKAAWLALGIRSEVGRGDNLLKMSDTVLEPDPEKRAQMRTVHKQTKSSAWLGKKAGGKMGAAKDEGEEGEWTGTSIFDPVLCELAYRWFCPPGGLILDPFAGGSVRGVVAGLLGRGYHGIDLREEQVAANVAQWQEISAKPLTMKSKPIAPQWATGNSTVSAIPTCDFIWTCPPYFDLERYSDDPADLSNLGDYGRFMEKLSAIVKRCGAALKKDRFAGIVVGDIRDKKGNYRNFVSDTIGAFLAAGLALYNEAILVTAVGSLPIRINKQFSGARKLGKTHQNVLIFLKGDPVKAAKAIGEVEFSESLGEETEFGERITAESLAGEVGK